MIRPAYWTDADLHTRLTADQREFYVGLWMEADDAGFIHWDIDRIGAELYPYRTAAWRRDRLPKWLALLNGHIRILDCGQHIIVVNLTRYQKPPRPSAQYRREHEETCPHHAPRGAKREQVVAAQGFSRGLDRGGVGEEGGAPGADGLTTDEETDFRRRYAATGAKVPA